MFWLCESVNCQSNTRKEHGSHSGQLVLGVVIFLGCVVQNDPVHQWQLPDEAGKMMHSTPEQLLFGQHLEYRTWGKTVVGGVLVGFPLAAMAADFAQGAGIKTHQGGTCAHGPFHERLFFEARSHAKVNLSTRICSRKSLTTMLH